MATINDKLIGNRIREARIACGLTQEQLADKLNFTEAYCSRVEHGKARINLERLYDYCRILHLHEMDILKGCCQEIYEEPIPCTEDPAKDELHRMIDSAPPSTIPLLRTVVEAIIKHSQQE